MTTTTVYYAAIIERVDKGYSVFFPDLPGCACEGKTLDKAKQNAGEALTRFVAQALARGELLDTPSDIDDLYGDPDVEEIERILVPAQVPSVSTQ